jgi:hypothetical protein
MAGWLYSQKGRKRRSREVGADEGIYQRIKTYEMEGLVSVSLDQVRGWDEPQSTTLPSV